MGQGSIIGYEINEKTCQISFYNDKETWSRRRWKWIRTIIRFRLIIGKLRDTWAYGKEAKTSCYDSKTDLQLQRLTSKQKSCWGKDRVWRRDI